MLRRGARFGEINEVDNPFVEVFPVRWRSMDGQFPET
jgi:hypothetical protein